MKKVCYKWIPPHTTTAKFFSAQPLGQTPRVADFNPIVVYFNENIRSRPKVVPVLDAIIDGKVQLLAIKSIK